MIGEIVTRQDERMVPREDMADEFPDGVPLWAEFLPAEELRRVMTARREGFTKLGFDPAEDEMDKEHYH